MLAHIKYRQICIHIFCPFLPLRCCGHSGQTGGVRQAPLEPPQELGWECRHVRLRLRACHGVRDTLSEHGTSLFANRTERGCECVLCCMCMCMCMYALSDCEVWVHIAREEKKVGVQVQHVHMCDYRMGDTACGCILAFLYVNNVCASVESFFRFTAYFDTFGSHIDPWTDVGVKVAFIALVSTIVESLPITDKLDDNLTVPLSAVIVGTLLFPSSPL